MKGRPNGICGGGIDPVSLFRDRVIQGGYSHRECVIAQRVILLSENSSNKEGSGFKIYKGYGTSDKTGYIHQCSDGPERKLSFRV